MEFTGTITGDAKITNISSERTVVNFSIAINDRYKPKGATEAKDFTTYINIAWWKGKGIASILNKGAIVTISGRLFVNVYNDMNGNPKGNINCHADSIKLIRGKKSTAINQPQPSDLTEPVEDLPF